MLFDRGVMPRILTLQSPFHVALCIGPLRADVSVRACTSCRPFVITSKQKGVVAELLDTVAKNRFVQKISVLRVNSFYVDKIS